MEGRGWWKANEREWEGIKREEGDVNEGMERERERNRKVSKCI